MSMQEKHHEQWWEPSIEQRGHQDFMAQFGQWASEYDETVWNQKGRFADVFLGYQSILSRVADLVTVRPGDVVVDVGTGTGNLAQMLFGRGYQVIGVEPSAPMMEEAQRKLPSMPLYAGHFLELPLPDSHVEAVVSTYAFHHLTDREKFQGIREMLRTLKPGGKIVLADITFLNESVRRRLYHDLGAAGRADFVAELEAEPYTTVDVLEELFDRAGCRTRFEQLTPWVWAVEAMAKHRMQEL